VILYPEESGNVLITLGYTLLSGGGGGEVVPIRANENRFFLREGFEWDKKQSHHTTAIVCRPYVGVANTMG
jgi:hypothetical protein